MQARAKSKDICTPLEIEDYVVQPHHDISPPKWHLGHTTWFLEELILNKFLDDYEFYHPSLRIIYNSYYKGLGEHWDQGERGFLSRPTVKEVYEYRDIIDAKVCDLIDRNSNPEFLRMIEVAINHEEQHQELLLMDIKSILAINPLTVTYSEETNPTVKKERKWKHIPAGLYEIGTKKNGFAFDNEGPVHQEYLSDFKISSTLITNGEFLKFIQAGGYTEPKWWLSMGFDWVKKEKIQAPLYWRKVNDEWWEFTLNGSQRLNESSPVSHISYFEADAFARWCGKRLPTEEEFEVSQKDDTSNELWSWTKSSYEPYPGYKPFDGEIAEYNGKFMCNQYVLRGGCFATPRGHYRKTYRNFYEPNQRWMFSGITLAEDYS